MFGRIARDPNGTHLRMILGAGDDEHLSRNLGIAFPQTKECLNHFWRPLLLNLAVRDGLEPISSKQLYLQPRVHEQAAKFIPAKYSTFTLHAIAFAERVGGSQ